MDNNRDPLKKGRSEPRKEIKTIGEIAAENDITNVEEPGRYFMEPTADKNTYIDEP
ncbi:hypothetical protein [Paenibacillus sp. GYB003]|uniref:hypothetical protein n=1 Tax=Paenibacillus sp. GYB003 TaxID=2994392 RepID=UPI002F964E07